MDRSGLDAPWKFLADNEGEFVNEECWEACENLNTEVMKTAAESPWQNGQCVSGITVLPTGV